MQGTTIRDLVGEWARETPGAPAIGSIEARTTTYSELADLLDQRGAELASMGISDSDLVAIVVPNGPLLATSLLTVASIATAAPLNPALTTAEFKLYLADLEARALIISVDEDSPSVEAANTLGIPIVRLVLHEDDPAGSFTFNGIGDTSNEVRYPDPSAIAFGVAYLGDDGPTQNGSVIPCQLERFGAQRSRIARAHPKGRLSQRDAALSHPRAGSGFACHHVERGIGDAQPGIRSRLVLPLG